MIIALIAALFAAPSSAATVPTLDASFAEAVHALRAVRPAAFSEGRDADQLLALLDDNDAAVRASAAKALRDYATQERRVSDRLVALMNETNENPFVRKEAVKSLSLAAEQSNDVRRAILAIAQNSSDNEIVRAIACKALFSTLYPNSSANDARDALIGLLQDSNERPAVRAGAAWGLFPDAATGRTQDALLAAAQDQWLDAGARVEALRSLYFVLPQRRATAEAVRALVDDGFTAYPVRVAGVLIHQILRDENPTRDWLRTLAASASPDAVRVAAVQAQADITPEMARYFHYTTLNRHWLDPLADE